MESTSLVKALAVLEATAANSAGRTLAVLSLETGLTKPTTHRILKTLVSLGFLEQTATGDYRQTPRVRRLVSNDPSDRLVATAEPVLRSLHETTRETVNLAVLRGDQVVYLRVLESTLPLRRIATPNSVDPFHTTALGRAIVSHLPAAIRDGLMRRAKLEARTPHSNVDPESLTDVLQQAANDGYALEVDETDVGVTCIGVPIMEQGIAIAAISISVPTARATGESLTRLIRRVRRASREINDRLNPTKVPRSAKRKSSRRVQSRELAR